MQVAREELRAAPAASRMIHAQVIGYTVIVDRAWCSQSHECSHLFLWRHLFLAPECKALCAGMGNYNSFNNLSAPEHPARLSGGLGSCCRTTALPDRK